MTEEEMTESGSLEAEASVDVSAEAPQVQDQAVAEPEATEQAADTETLLRRIADLERQLDDLEQARVRESEQATDYMNRYQRAQADFANFKRRAEQDQEHRDVMATAQVLSLILPALDSFERAFTTLPPSLLGFSWIDGISLIHMELHHALQIYGAQQIETRPGQEFDPLRHQSVGEVESSEHAEGRVAVVLQSGYEMRGRVLRPTLVQLARPPAAAAAGATEESSSGGSGEDG
jgi:molecular chaperone GrpE